jgi:hypothetical protein
MLELLRENHRFQQTSAVDGHAIIDDRRRGKRTVIGEVVVMVSRW